jgi:hypothetical protein
MIDDAGTGRERSSYIAAMTDDAANGTVPARASRAEGDPAGGDRAQHDASASDRSAPDASASDSAASDRPAPDAVVPDTKDWTWVLQRRCAECGFVAADAEIAAIPDVVRSLTPRWREALARPDARTRPAAGVWSALEYGAHVRDVNRIFRGRLQAMLSTDDPLFANWDQDAAAVDDHYGEQDPARVADELADAADAFADLLASTAPEQWERPGRRSNGSVFTVRTLSQYYLHDVVHHLHDVHA